MSPFSFEYEPAPTPSNPEGIKILHGWVAQNIITVNVPQLSKVTSTHVPINKLCADAFLQLWADWEAAGLLDRVLTWNGSFVPRFIRGSTTRLSNHAYGTAFDINAQWNRLGTEPVQEGYKGCVRELVPIAVKHGFTWGGNYKHRLDGMHFEWLTTQS